MKFFKQKSNNSEHYYENQMSKNSPDSNLNSESQPSRKRYGRQLVIVAIIFISFVVFMQLMTEPKTEQTIPHEPEEDKEEIDEGPVYNPTFSWPEVQTKEELNRQFHDTVPGLERAEDLGFVKEINETINIKNTNLDLIVEKAWYTSEGVYVFYSINYKEDMNDIFFEFYKKDGSILSISHYGTRVIFEDRLHEVIKLKPVRDEDRKIIENYEGDYSFNLEMRRNGIVRRIKDQSIPLSFSKEKEDEYAFNVSINKTIANDWLTLTIDDFESRLYGNTLSLSYESNDSLYRVEGPQTNVYQLQSLNVKPDENNQFEIKLGAFDEVPETLIIPFDEAQLMSDQAFLFNINTSDINPGESKRVEKLIDEIFQTEVYLEKINYIDDGIEVTIRLNQLSDDIYLMNHGPRIRNPESFNHLVVSNERDEVYHFSNFSSFGSNHRFGFTIPSEFVEESEGILVEIENLLYGVNLNGTVEVPIKE